jgi:hypothetical protein
MIKNQGIDHLITVLKDPFEPLEGRDDAAMLLGESDTSEAFRALLCIASDSSEDDLLQSTAGEMLARIMLRNGLFQNRILDQLTPLARSELEGLIMHDNPAWVS